MNKVRINFQAKLKAGIKFDEQAGVFITYSPALGLYSQGETELQAKNALEDAVQSFLIVAYKNKVLEKCLPYANFSTGQGPSDFSYTADAEEEYVAIAEERVLEHSQFSDIFDIPALLPLVAAVNR